MSLLSARRSVLSLVLGGAVAALAPSPARAQCPGEEVLLEYLDAGTSTLLRTPLGAPVLGGPFGFQVRNGPASMLGVLFYSGFADPIVDPMLGTIWPQFPWFTWFFGTNATGNSPIFLSTPEITDDLCGVEAVFQAVVIDPGAPAGSVLTNALRLRVGDVVTPPFGPVIEPVAFSYNDMTVGDVDGDGLDDVVATRLSSVVVRFRQPGGGFGPEVLYGPGGTSPISPRLADVNGDGNTDIVVLHAATATARVLYLDATATVFSVATLPVGASPVRAALGDVDLNGRLDLFVATGSTSVSMLRGSAPGVLLFDQPVAVGAAQTAALVGDLDVDGNPDLVAAAAGTVVRLGNGDGTFAPAATFGASTLRARLLADVDGDSALDVVGTDTASLAVQRGNGDGTLQAAALYLSGLASNPPVAGALVRLVDLDGDSLEEALVTWPNQGGNPFVYVYTGLPGGAFSLARAFAIARLASGMDVTDANGDGRADLIVTETNSNPFSLNTLLGNGDGTFRSSQFVVPSPASTSNFIPLVGDLDGDGLDDVVAFPSGSVNAFVLLTTPSGPGAAAPLTLATSSEVVPRLVDIDGDGALDLFTAQGSSGANTTTFRVRLGDGSGGFGAAVTTVLSPVGGGGPLADFDEDGELDSLGSHEYFPGNGDGTFAAPLPIPLPATGQQLVADVDVDGHLDIILIPNSFPSFLQFVRGNGDGTFELVLSRAISIPSVRALRDVTSDGIPDLVGMSGDATLLVSPGAGDGTFLPPIVTVFTSTQALGGPLLEDLDGNGKLDAVLTSGSFDEVWLSSGNGDGTFGTPTRFEMPEGPIGLALGDLDDDGILDIVTSADLGTGRKGLWFQTSSLGE